MLQVHLAFGRLQTRLLSVALILHRQGNCHWVEAFTGRVAFTLVPESGGLGVINFISGLAPQKNLFNTFNP